MKLVTMVAMVIIGVSTVIFLKDRSAKNTFKKIYQDTVDSVNTDDEIYKNLVTCILINGSEFNSKEELEEDLAERDLKLNNLVDEGFLNDEIYPKLNEVEKKIYLIINGFSLELFPEYLVAKSINILEK